MNGPHDVGGDQGFGPLPLERDEPVFHHEWERRVLALTLAMGATGKWNIDTSRSVRESLPPATYLSSSYYEIWFEALLILLEQAGLLSAEERDAVDSGDVTALAAALGNAGEAGRAREAGRACEAGEGSGPAPAAMPSPPALRVLRADQVAPALAAGSPTARRGAASRFRVGDRVRVKLMNPVGHTRAPRYVRGRPGVVTFDHGNHVLPDVNFRGQGEAAEPLYTVRFAASELWGEDTTAAAISVDCWESYLVAEPAAAPATTGQAHR